MASKIRYSRLFGSATNGVNAVSVTVETSIIAGIPRHTIVGLPNSAVKEALDRIRAALKASGFEIPRGAITVNLAPADIRKEGTLYDLTIALGILAADGVIAKSVLKSTDLILGELSLNGAVRPVKGVLTAVLGAFRGGFKRVIVPYENFAEASAISEIQTIPVKTLQHAVAVLQGRAPADASDAKEKMAESLRQDPFGNGTNRWPDICQVLGQRLAIRGMEIAAVGQHNLIMVGPPGCGKTMLSRAFQGIQSNWTRQQQLESTSIHSLRGLTRSGLLRLRPFRSPHHSVSKAGLLGGGNPTLPGEISLAHNGFLFLDELAEFSRSALEGLREPLEEGRVILSRVSGSVEYPARFQMIAAMNPCPCGYAGTDDKTCNCSPLQRQRYESKISGPLLDRIHMRLSLRRVDPTLNPRANWVTSAEMKERVNAATQILHYSKAIELPEDVKEFLNRSILELRMSMRARDRIATVSRSIAALDGRDIVQAHDVNEALNYRITGFEAEDEKQRARAQIIRTNGFAQTETSTETDGSAQAEVTIKTNGLGQFDPSPS